VSKAIARTRRRTVAGRHTFGGRAQHEPILHWPQPAIERYSRAPRKGSESKQLLAQRREWYARRAWTRDWPAEQAAHRAAYELMQEINAA
jgi:hypothetical protein